MLSDSFAALDGMRRRPSGEDRDAGASLNTDRKFAGQTEDDAAGAGLQWFRPSGPQATISACGIPAAMV